MNLKNALMALLVFAFLTNPTDAQEHKARLVVGVVIDQMRSDQLYRYQDKFSDDGFKKVLKSGFNFKNAHYTHTPTVTAAGHASIYTGTTPSVHGIVANSWYDRTDKSYRHSVQDSAVTLIGSAADNDRGASPKQLLTTTLSDQLKMHTQQRAKVISVSLKDRAAVLSGGHSADAAYWQDVSTSPGYFVSSTYYMDELPDWVKQFNAGERADNYLNKEWTPLYPIESYNQSHNDNNKYEMILGDDTPTFPYDFKKIREKYRPRNLEYMMLGFSPWGNTLVTDFALEAIRQEKLGQNKDADFLAISYSVTDKAGHLYGPDSVELADIYARLDRELARLINHLDNTVGEQDYTLFITSDHGAIPVVSYLHDIDIPTDVARTTRYKSTLEQYFDDKYGEADWVERFSDEHVYLNRKLIREKNLNLSVMQQLASNILIEQEGVRAALTATNLRTHHYANNTFRQWAQNGFHPKRSGDIVLVYESGVIQDDDSEALVSSIKGTVHGSGYSYDRHVPLLMMGKGISNGVSVRRVSPIDIPATLAMMLNVQLPSGNGGEPLRELFQ